MAGGLNWTLMGARSFWTRVQATFFLSSVHWSLLAMSVRAVWSGRSFVLEKTESGRTLTFGGVSENLSSGETISVVNTAAGEARD